MEAKTILKLKAEPRDIFGKNLADVRKQGKLPAVFYGPKEKNRSIFVDFVDFKKIWKEGGESTIIKLDIGGKETDVLIYNIDMEPIKNEPVHVDFYALDMTKKITTFVPLEFVGEAPAVKSLSGILVKVVHEVEVEAMPKDLPSEIAVDISGLEAFEDRITIGDLKLPEGVKLLANLEDVVCFAEEPKEEEEPEEEAPNLEDIEVEREKKEGKEGEEGGEDEKKSAEEVKGEKNNDK